MSHARLIPEEKKREPRSHITVELSFECEKFALMMADYLEELSEKIDDENGGCYAWAKELANLIRNE